MSIFQLVSALFAVFMLYIVNIHKRKSALSSLEVFLWRLMWMVFIFLSLFPASLTGIVDALHFARVFDLLVVSALMVITTLVVISYFNQKANSRKLEELVRKIAMKKSQAKNHE